MDILLLSAALFGLGIYNWKLSSALEEANTQIENYYELIIQMAEELQSLGSPNVKVTKIEAS